jgi:hypothetical protein
MKLTTGCGQDHLLYTELLCLSGTHEFLAWLCCSVITEVLNRCYSKVDTKIEFLSGKLQTRPIIGKPQLALL